MLGHLVAFAWWSCGFPTAQLCSPQPHPQHVFIDMHQYGFGVLMSPDSFCALARICDGVWLYQTSMYLGVGLAVEIFGVSLTSQYSLIESSYFST